ncbi:MAG: hypothetical protein ACYC09_14425, partial [Bacteroidota bacterium]
MKSRILIALFVCLIFSGCIPETYYIEVPVRRVNVILKDKSTFKAIVRSIDNSFVYFNYVNKTLTKDDSLIQYTPDDGKTWYWRGTPVEIVDQHGKAIKASVVIAQNPTMIRISKYSIESIHDEFGTNVSSEY